MAENKKSFILYADQKELFNQLPNEKAGELIKHIFAYVNDEEPITEDLLINLAFTPIKQQFKRDLKRWESTREGRSKAGKASAEARRNKKKQESTNSTNVNFVQQTSTNSTVNVNDNVNVTVNDNVKEINIEFDLFWNLYDKKISKTKCESKWLKLTDKEREDIIAFIPKYKLSTPDVKFRKNPETFFNNKSWNDEIQGLNKNKQYKSATSNLSF